MHSITQVWIDINKADSIIQHLIQYNGIIMTIILLSITHHTYCRMTFTHCFLFHSFQRHFHSSVQLLSL